MTYLTQLQEALRQPSEPTTGFTPLTDQILALTAHLPPIQLNRPFSIDELLPQLKGRYQARPATREVAKALTQLGWTRHRNWTIEGRNKRYWFPPMDDDS